MDDYKIALGALLDANAKGDINKQLNAIKDLSVTISKATLSNDVINDIKRQLTQNGIDLKLVFGNANQITNQAQQVGQQIGNNIAQGVHDGVTKANSTMKSFSQLTDSMKSQNILFNNEGLQDTKLTLDEIKKTYSEFGQVNITNQTFNLDELQSFKVNIEQVNGELKETRSFMMSLSNDKTSFVLPSDVIKGTEKYVQHLNTAKNVINATGEEANALKQKLAEQEKYYGNIKKEVNTLYSLKTKLLSADELETAELERQIKSTKQRITYNNQQIDKKGLRDNSLIREVNDLEVAKQNQLALAEARLQDSTNAKSQAQSQKELNAALKEQQSLVSQSNRIQLSWQTEGYQSKVDSLVARTNQWVDANGNARISTESLQTALNNLGTAYTNINSSGGNTVANQQALIEAEKALDTEIKKVQNSVASMNATMAKSSAVDSLRQKVQMFYDTNTAAHRKWGSNLKSIMSQLASGTEVPITELRKLNQEFINIQNAARHAGKLGLSFFDTIKQGMKKFSYWTSSTFLVMKGITEVKQAISSIKELDTALVDLKKTTTMTDSQLEKFYYTANDVAKQMGVTTKEIIDQASSWSRLGFSSAEAATQMAKLSAQFKTISPGMTLDEATDGLVSVMKAYGIEVNDVLDGIMSKINIVGNNKALNNSDIVDFLTRSSAAMAEANNSLEETIALGEAAVEITRDAASVGNVLKTTSMRIRSYDEETESYSKDLEVLKGKIADLTKTAKTPGGISLFTDETKQTYKSTYQILEEISTVWKDLTDKNQADLLEVLAGKRNGQALAAIISNFDSARESMELMANSAGNANAEMSVIIDSIEYKSNKLKETGTGIAQNLFKREDMKTVLDMMNSLGEGLDWLTKKLGLFGTITLGTGLFAGIKNIGVFKTLNGDLTLFNKTLITTKNNLKNLNTISATVYNKNGRFNLDGLILNSTKISGTFTKLNNAFNSYNSNLSKSTQLQNAYIKAIGSQNTALGNYLAGLNGAKASMNGYIGSLISAKVASIGLKVASIALNTAITMGVSLGISALVSQISKWIHAQEEARQKSFELTNSYKEQQSSLDSQIEKYKELKETLDKGNLSTDEARSIKEQLLEVQKSLNESYGNEASNIDLVNGKYKEQLGLLSDLSKEKATEYTTENRDVFADAKESLNKIRSYNFGTISSWSSYAPQTEDNKKLLEYLKNYSDLLDLTYSQSSGRGAYGVSVNMSVKADVESADKLMRQLAKDIELYGKNNNIDVSKILEGISKQLKNTWTDDLKEYKDIYDEFIKAEVVRNDTLRPLYQESIKAVEDYNEALSTGKGVEKAKSNLDSVQQSVKNATGELEGSQDVFDGIYDGINKDAEAVYNLGQLFRNDKTVQEYAEQLRGLSDIDLKAINFKDTIEQPGEKAFTSLMGYLGYTEEQIQILIDKLVELGFVQGEIQESIQSKNKTTLFNLSEDSNKVLDDYQKSFKDIKKTLQDINSLDNDEILDIIQEYNLDTTKATSSTQGLREELERVANEKFDSLLESLNEMRDCGELTKEEFENLVSLFEKLSNISLLDFTRNSFDDLSKEINNVASKLKDIDSAIESVNKGEKLNASSVLSLIQTYPELAKKIKKTTDGYEIEISVLEELRKKDLEVQSSKIRSEIDKTKATIDESKTRVLAYSSEISALEELKKVQDSFGTESIKPTVPLWLQDAMGVMPNASPVEDTLNQLKEKQKKDLQDINESQKLIESLYEQLNLLGSGNYSTDSSNSSKGGKGEDAWKNEADAKIEELRHKLAMELITERTFYNELEKINEKYFKGKKKYQDDYWKYEEEVYSGRAKLYEQDYEAEKKVLEKKLNDKKISEKRYYTELRKLNDKYFKDNKKYKDRWQETDDEVTEKLFDIDISSYKNAIQRYENTKKDISNKISSYETKDKVVPDSYYKKQIKQNNLEIKTYQELAKEYIKLRENARKVSGYNSEAYVEYDNLLQECQDSVAKLNDENVELNNTLLNLPYERFEKLKDKINNVIDSLSGYLDLLDSLDSYDENGKITDAGTTKMALLQQQLESAKVLAEESTKNIYNIQKKYKNGEFKDNFEEYRKKLLEYQAEQREAVSNIASYRSSIISLINDGIDAETDAMQDLIDKKKEAISVEKELYELQKSATEDNKSIEILNKQIAEFSRSTDRADIAQRQKLEDELRKKKEKQLDEQKQREFKLREDALEDELNSFKETQDDKKAELRSSLNSQDRIIDGWLNGVITSNNTVFSTLTALSNNFGLELTSAITDPWTKGIDTIGKWSNAVKSALSMSSTSDITTSAPSNVLTKNTSGTKQTAETELNKYIISKGYNKLTWSQMAKLGQDLGVANSTYKNVESSGVIRMEILKKLKSTGFESGGIVRASGVPLTGDRIPIRVNPNETILTKKFTDLLPSTVQVMSKFVDIKMPNTSYINGLSRNVGNDVNMNFSEPLVVISGVTKDEINAETQKRIAEIPNMMLRELKQIGVNKK